MTFRGLFIGIDRCASQRINWLSCARRDAVALHALFTDTLGGEAVLLTDEEATRSEIKKQFDQLAKCAKDDVVVIAFSGHGAQTHELVTYDANPDDLASSCISLDILTEWFARVPARRLICILDCCFSGGMGAKVLQVDVVPRDLCSTEDILQKLSGEGRLIITASAATQSAWENPRIGHGLLTCYLIEALQGTEEVIKAGKITFYRLLDYVTQRVTAAAAQLGKEQHPTVRGKIDRELKWPIFKPGPLFNTAFPERVRPKITADVQSLADYRFPIDLLKAWASSISRFNQLQIDAINEFNVLDGNHLIVTAPTSSGKTMIGELAALRGILERKRALFLLPLKALVNDKHQQFINIYGEFGFRTIRATGDSNDDIPSLMRGQYDICLMTYEKFAALVLGSPHILEQVGTVVVDEVQMIADKSRGVNLEFILTLLRMRRLQGIEPQLITLSAAIGDTNGLERWLGARLLRRTERPVPLEEGVLRSDGSFRYIEPESGKEKIIKAYIRTEFRKGSSQDWVVPLVRKLVGEGKQVIVFRETRGEARGCANYLSEALGLPSAKSALDTLPSGDPSIASQALRKALSGGVAFHISDLDRDERLVIEEQFRVAQSTIRVIAATTTLAMGVNTPAEAVVVVGLEHPGPKPYSVAEYKNIVGRAGRLGIKERGASYLLALSPREEYNAWSHYLLGVPENLESRFLDEGTDPRSLIIRVLVAAQQSTSQGLMLDEIVDFLEGSFGAFQQTQVTQRWKWDRDQLITALKNLEEHELVKLDNNTYRLTELGWIAGQAGVEVESITRLVDVLTPIDVTNINDPTLITATQLTVELDDLLFPINKKSTRKEPQTWKLELERQSVSSHVIRALQRYAREELQATLRAKKAVACLLWVTDKPLAKIEEILTQFGGQWNGAAGPIRGVSSRTHDLLFTVVRVAEILHPGLDLTERGARLLTRLEVGVPASVIDLATQIGTRFTRADYQSLINARLCSIEAIEASSDNVLLSCFGGNRMKLSQIHEAVKHHHEQKTEEGPILPILPKYEG